MKLSVPISVQHVTKFGSIEVKLLEAVTSIWKTLSEINNKTLILVWYPKVENGLRPIRSVDLTKPLSKKTVKDTYIETLQMGWYSSNTTLCFRIDQNQHITSLLDDPNLIYLFDIHEVELIKKKYNTPL